MSAPITALRRSLARELSNPPDDSLLLRAATLDRIASVVKKATGCRSDNALELSRLMYEDLHGVQLPATAPGSLCNHNGLHVMRIEDRCYLFNPAAAAIVTGEPMLQWVATVPTRTLFSVLTTIGG